MNKIKRINDGVAKKARYISVIVDNPSWIIPYAKKLIDLINGNNDIARFYDSPEKVDKGYAAFYLGCTKIVSPRILSRSQYNLVVHESDLPRGKGFAPVAWQVLEGKSRIPVCLFEAVENVDAGNIYLKDEIVLDGFELNDEIRNKQGEKTIELCLRFLNTAEAPQGIKQEGEESFYKRRTPSDSRLDTGKTIDEQFNLLRVVDNEQYPAYFEKNGHRYILSIKKDDC